MGLLEKANRRKCYPVALEDRTVYVRSMTIGELNRMEAIEKNLQTPFVMGCCLVSEKGVPEVTPGECETDEDFADRVATLMDFAEVDTEVIALISRAIGKIGKVDVETLAKN